MAIPHGWLILASMSIGIATAASRPDFGHHPAVLFFLALCNIVLILTRNWVAFLAAIDTAFLLPLVAFPLVQGALRHHPLRIMLWSWLVADLMTFFQVLTVAYAFVPGGMPFREKTWAMLAVQLVFLSVGLRQTQSSDSKTAASISHLSLPRPIMRCLIALLAAIVAVAVAVSRIRLVDTSTIIPHHAHDGSRVFTAGIQTVHFGLDQLFHDSSRRMADLYSDLQLDVLGLLETDLHRSVFGNRDLTQYLAQSLGMYADIGPSPLGHTWGCVLLSKFPIVNTTHHLLPSPDGELAPAIHAVLDAFGEHVNVWVSHNGQEETPVDRELQTKAIARVASATYPQPFVFLGYLVTEPHAERPSPYKILFEDGRIHDVEPLDSMRWCQYIGFRSLSRVAYIRVSRYTLTDTELQLAKFRVPNITGGEAPLDPSRDDKPRLVNHDHPMVRPEWWFPTHYIDRFASPSEKFSYTPWVYPRYYAPNEEEAVGV